MRTTLAALSLAAGIGLVCCQSAGAAPISGFAVLEAATAASTVQQAEYKPYMSKMTKKGYMKCYNEAGVGAYGCHVWGTW